LTEDPLSDTPPRPHHGPHHGADWPPSPPARVASDAGFRIHIVDDREKFANAERFPAADQIVVEDIAGWLHRAELPPSAFVVVVTRGHTHDFDALRALAARDLRYLGLIGSRAKVARVFDALRAEGMPPECLARVHAPIGLDIGAITPAEIAISILAELIAIRHGKDVSAVSMKWARPAQRLGS
jgi:xanthine dehydrogenase accessory factor